MRNILLILTGSCALWFCAKSGYGAWNYLHLNALTSAQIEQWSVEDSGSYARIAASYSYEVEGKRYTGKTIFKEPEFLNRLSAENQLKSWEQHHYQAWYSSFFPGSSSLQKIFPYKSTVYALISVGVAIFFWIMFKKANP
jgi:hypothetical protein